MEHAKKMVLVDPRMLDAVKTAGPPVPDATSESVRDMDEHMRNILDRSDLHVDEKAQLYQQTLMKYLNRVNQFRHQPLGTVELKSPSSLPPWSPPPHEQQTMRKEVLHSVPKTLKKKAERLLDHIERNPDLAWNPRGEIEYQGQRIPDTNVVDLINDILRKRQQFTPKGWETFATALRQSNVPQDLVGHPDRWAFMVRDSPPQQSPRTPLAPPSTLEQLTPPRKRYKKRKTREKVSDWETY